jgi:hypothetical protein
MQPVGKMMPRFTTSEAVPHVGPLCDDLLTGFLPHDTALTPHTVEQIHTLGALCPRGGPVPDPIPTEHQPTAVMRS